MLELRSPKSFHPYEIARRIKLKTYLLVAELNVRNSSPELGLKLTASPAARAALAARAASPRAAAMEVRGFANEISDACALRASERATQFTVSFTLPFALEDY